jgi:hypothetical protein
MAGLIEIQVDTRRLEAAMREFAREGKKDLDDVIRQQAGIMTAHLIALTPPAAGRGQAMNDRGSIANEAKKRGEAVIAADIAALFPTSRLNDDRIEGMVATGFQWGTGRGKKVVREFAATEADLERIHRLSRGSSGRVRTGRSGENMAVTRAAVRRAYIKQAQRKVGLLNAGWLQAARELKTAKRATPAWITRHGAQAGGLQLMRTPTGLRLRVMNRLPWFPKDMGARVGRAVVWRTRGLEKALDAMLERQAKKAESRMGR